MTVVRQSDLAAVRCGEGDVDFQAVVGDLEARRVERGPVDAGQPLLEAAVPGGIDMHVRFGVELHMTVMSVGDQEQGDPAG
jgi:hypothetical protein